MKSGDAFQGEEGPPVHFQAAGPFRVREGCFDDECVVVNRTICGRDLVGERGCSPTARAAPEPDHPNPDLGCATETIGFEGAASGIDEGCVGIEIPRAADSKTFALTKGGGEDPLSLCVGHPVTVLGGCGVHLDINDQARGIGDCKGLGKGEVHAEGGRGGFGASQAGKEDHLFGEDQGFVLPKVAVERLYTGKAEGFGGCLGGEGDGDGIAVGLKRGRAHSVSADLEALDGLGFEGEGVPFEKALDPGRGEAKACPGGAVSFFLVPSLRKGPALGGNRSANKAGEDDAGGDDTESIHCIGSLFEERERERGTGGRNNKVPSPENRIEYGTPGDWSKIEYFWKQSRDECPKISEGSPHPNIIGARTSPAFWGPTQSPTRSRAKSKAAPGPLPVTRWSSMATASST